MHLLHGDDPFLLREAALELLRELRVTEVDAAGWSGGELQDLATPSLFGEARGLLITDARSLPKEAVEELARYASAPDLASPIVVCCEGKPLVALERAVKDIGSIRQVAVARKDLEGWVVARAKRLGVDLAVPTARALVAVIGESAAELASALEQLRDAYPKVRLTPDHVQSQFRGLGEQKSWDLCDKAFGHDLPGAVRALRSIEETGDDPLMVVGAIASRLRDLIKVRALPERMAPADVAREAGLRFDWQARRYQQQARGYSMQRLIELHGRVADADRSLKSGETSDVVMPILVAAIAAG